MALKPRGDVTRSPKQGYQWPHKKDLRPPILFFSKKGPASEIILEHTFPDRMAVDLFTDMYM